MIVKVLDKLFCGAVGRREGVSGGVGLFMDFFFYSSEFRDARASLIMIN